MDSITDAQSIIVAQSTARKISTTKTLAVDDNSNDVSMKSRELAFISHVDNPNRFYLQLNSKTAVLESLQELLQIVAPQLPALREFRVGELCIGKFSGDDCWYRAKIMDTDGKITSIQLIDYGNTDSITNHALLKAPNYILMEKEPFAIMCSMPISPHRNWKWTEKACKKLRTVSDDTPIEYELVSKYKDVSYVKVYSVDGRDLVRELIQEKLADAADHQKLNEMLKKEKP